MASPRLWKSCYSFLAPSCRATLFAGRSKSRVHTFRGGSSSCLHTFRFLSANSSPSPDEESPRKENSEEPLESPPPPPPTTHRISYLTDVEGSRDYLHRFIQQSRVLTFRPATTHDYSHNQDGYCEFPYDHCLDFLHPTDVLVYGGDVWDQGGSDLYVIRQLLHLQSRFPDRVFIVLGNRDINKMRLGQELGPPTANEDISSNGDLDVPPPEHGGAYWLKGSGRPGDTDLGLLMDSAVERLQWILTHTMGSPRAFDYRRWELEQEWGEPASPEDVVESYKRSSHPQGEMGRYLTNGRLVVQLGDALFLHGSLPLTQTVLEEKKNRVWDDLSFAMPWLDTGQTAQANGVHTVTDWLKALNDFCVANVEAWNTKATHGIWSTTGGYQHSKAFQPYAQLIQYGMGWIPGGIRNPTVVYASWCNDGMPRKFFPDAEPVDQSYVQAVQSFFQSTGVSLICSGHKPQGDMPNAIRVDLPDQNRTGWILSCDTSYSGDTLWHNLPGDTHHRQNIGRGESPSGRGDAAVSEVVIEQCSASGKTLSVVCHGTLCDGTEYETQELGLDCGLSLDEKDLVVGTLAAGPLVPDEANSPNGGPWWTRAAFTDGSYLLTTGKGFHVWNRIVKP